LQVGAATWLPPEHEPAPHTVPDGQSLQAPPLHLPSVPQVDAAVAAQRSRGSLLPSVATLHVPFTPPVSAAEQAWQASVHILSQQNPSTQKVLAHWAADAHAEPGWRAPLELEEEVLDVLDEEDVLDVLDEEDVLDVLVPPVLPDVPPELEEEDVLDVLIPPVPPELLPPVDAVVAPPAPPLDVEEDPPVVEVGLLPP
jgi:hypothetical protein